MQALLNRMLAYSYQIHVGLVTVGSTPVLRKAISHVLQDFRTAIVDMSASGRYCSPAY
jgi:hypothetical protein